MSAELRHTILLVEADRWDAGLVEVALTELEERPYLRICPRRFELVRAETLQEACDYLAELEFDAVLLDLNLPDSKALHTLVRLRDVAPQVPIVILTGRDDELLAISAMREGAQDYLIKDALDCEPLARCLRYAIERSLLDEASRNTGNFTDELTGLYNRDAFHLMAAAELRLASKAGLPLTLILAEVTGFDEVRDSYELQQRHLATLEAAGVLQNCLGSHGSVARVARNRFAALAVHQPVLPEASATLALSFTAIPVPPDTADSIEDLLRRAEEALCENRPEAHQLAL